MWKSEWFIFPDRLCNGLWWVKWLHVPICLMESYHIHTWENCARSIHFCRLQKWRGGMQRNYIHYWRCAISIFSVHTRYLQYLGSRHRTNVMALKNSSSVAIHAQISNVLKSTTECCTTIPSQQCPIYNMEPMKTKLRTPYKQRSTQVPPWMPRRVTNYPPMPINETAPCNHCAEYFQLIRHGDTFQSRHQKMTRWYNG